MKKRNIGFLAGAMALAGLAGMGQVKATAVAAQEKATVNYDSYKATEKRKVAKQKISINNVTGGLDFDHGQPFGLTPKEYGMRYGHALRAWERQG